MEELNFYWPSWPCLLLTSITAFMILMSFRMGFRLCNGSILESALLSVCVGLIVIVLSGPVIITFSEIYYEGKFGYNVENRIIKYVPALRGQTFKEALISAGYDRQNLSKWDAELYKLTQKEMELAREDLVRISPKGGI